MATATQPRSRIGACTNMAFVADTGEVGDTVGVRLELESVEYDADNGFLDFSYDGRPEEAKIRIPARHIDGLIAALMSVRDRARVALEVAPAILKAGNATE